MMDFLNVLNLYLSVLLVQIWDVLLEHTFKLNLCIELHKHRKYAELDNPKSPKPVSFTKSASVRKTWWISDPSIFEVPRDYKVGLKPN